jgi:translation initiation factor IF-3
VNFVGRTIVFKERGVNLLNKFSSALTEYGKLEMEPKLEGKRMTIILAPALPKK